MDKKSFKYYSKRKYSIICICFYLIINQNLLAQIPDFTDSLTQITTRDIMLDLPFIEKGSMVTVEIKESMVVMEGDILIGNETKIFGQKAIVTNRSNAKWHKGIIPYLIQNGHPRSADINRAIQHIDQRTNVTLVPYTGQTDYVSFIRGSGCSSFVGRIGGKQRITIDFGCDFGAVVHEICHAIGLWHEQSRCDRDKYVDVYLNNVAPAKRHNFQKHCRDGIDVGSYDYRSIMHYQQNAFSMNGNPTILPKNNSISLGQRQGLSSGDIAAINKLYPATTTTTVPPPSPIVTTGNGHNNNKLIEAIDDFTPNSGWQKAKHVRVLGDVNGDGKDDIIAFGDNAVFVSFGQANKKFTSPQIAIHDFSYYNGKWRTEKHERMVGDVNGDGKTDIIGFGQFAVLVALANKNNTFDDPIIALKDFTIGTGGWKKAKHVRRVGDVNGDGKADIIGFGEGDVLIALGQGNGTFSKPIIGIKDFSYASGGWRIERHERLIGDVNGDGSDDIIGFGEYKVLVALSNKDGTFKSPISAINDYTVRTGGWKKNKHLRRIGDVDGDGRADIIGFGEQAVFVSYGRKDGTFSTPKPIVNDFTYSSGKWRTSRHERLVGDINGDKKAEIVGFGEQVTFTYSLH